jgi:hypothetical protein
MMCSSRERSAGMSASAARLLSAAATAGAALLGGAIANANPPQPNILDVHYYDTFGGYVSMTITWDGSVYTTETMFFDSAINATNGPTLQSNIYNTSASYGDVTGLASQQTYAASQGTTVEIGCYAYDGYTNSYESWLGGEIP